MKWEIVKQIFRKEFNYYFRSPIAYIVLTIFLGLTGYFFVADLFVMNQATIRNLVTLIPLFLVFFIPAITMRLIAEEKREGTIEILATLPVSEPEVIIGKFLAAWVLVIIGLALTVIYPITLEILGDVDWGSVIGSYVGLILVSFMFTSVGIWASSLTASQIVAMIVGLVIAFVFFLLGKVANFAPDWLSPFLAFVGIDQHMENLSRGVIDTRNIIYFITVGGLFLFLTYLTYKRFFERLMGSATLVLVVLIVFFGNLISYYVYHRWDISEGRVYSLSPASVKLVRELHDPILVRAYVTAKLPPPYNVIAEYVKDMLREYRAASRGRFKLEIINPNTPDKMREATRMGIQALPLQEVKAGEFALKNAFLGAVFIYGDKRETIPVFEDISNLEYQVTSLIRKLTMEEKPIIGIVKGHNEMELARRLKHEIEKLYELTEIDIETDSIPADVGALIVVGPESPWSDSACKKLEQFLEQGGRAALFLSTYKVNLQNFNTTRLETGLDSLLAKYGIKLEPGFVVDPVCENVRVTTRQGFFTVTRLVSYPFFVRATTLNSEHPITRNLGSVTFPFVSPVKGGKPLAWSSQYSWLVSTPFMVVPGQQYKPTGEQMARPLAAYTDSLVKLVVIGTATIPTEDYITPGGLTFCMNLVDWLVQDESLLAIRGKGIKARPLKKLSPTNQLIVRIANILVPIGILWGIGLYRRRSLYRTRHVA